MNPHGTKALAFSAFQHRLESTIAFVSSICPPVCLPACNVGSATIASSRHPGMHSDPTRYANQSGEAMEIGKRLLTLPLYYPLGLLLNFKQGREDGHKPPTSPSSRCPAPRGQPETSKSRGHMPRPSFSLVADRGLVCEQTGGFLWQ